MKLQFQKNNEAKHIIRYIRSDASSSWTKGDNFLVLHDLSHYAIEKTLGYGTAFYGMIKNGSSIQDFEDKSLRDNMNLTNEAWYAETLANLILIEYTQNAFENFNEVFRESLEKTNPELTAMVIAVSDLNNVRKLYRDLIAKWNQVPAMGIMELIF